MVDKMKLESKLSSSLLVLLVAGCLLVTVEGRPQGGVFRNIVLNVNSVRANVVYCETTMPD